MKITVKVNARAGKAPASVVRDRLKQLRGDAHVEEVFPGEQTGKRAGLVIVDLPDDTSDAESDQILQTLQADEHVEYAQRAASRKAKAQPPLTQMRRSTGPQRSRGR